MAKHYLQLKDLRAYNLAFGLSNVVWEIVATWNIFSKDTIGKQFVRSIDSISANLAEGFGRYTKKDKIHFYRYSYGSIKESIDWVEKARKRRLLTEDQYHLIDNELQKLPREVHHLISFTESKLTI